MIPNAQAFRAGAARAKTILRKKKEEDEEEEKAEVEPQSSGQRPTEVGANASQPQRTVLFVRDVMVKLPTRQPPATVANHLATGGVAAAANQADRAQEVPGERRQYPAGAKPDNLGQL